MLAYILWKDAIAERRVSVSSFTLTTYFKASFYVQHPNSTMQKLSITQQNQALIPGPTKHW